MRFSGSHFLIALLLLVAEVVIALFAHDNFIRPYLGDLLVVMLLHFGARTITSTAPQRVALAVLLFACFIELTQAFHLIDQLGLSGNIIAQLILGHQFQWLDLVMYATGCAFALVVDQRIVVHSPTGR